MKSQHIAVSNLLKDREVGCGRARIWTQKLVLLIIMVFRRVLKLSVDTSKDPISYVITFVEYLEKEITDFKKYSHLFQNRKLITLF